MTLNQYPTSQLQVGNNSKSYQYSQLKPISPDPKHNVLFNLMTQSINLTRITFLDPGSLFLQNKSYCIHEGPSKSVQVSSCGFPMREKTDHSSTIYQMGQTKMKSAQAQIYCCRQNYFIMNVVWLLDYIKWEKQIWTLTFVRQENMTTRSTGFNCVKNATIFLSCWTTKNSICSRCALFTESEHHWRQPNCSTHIRFQLLTIPHHHMFSNGACANENVHTLLHNYIHF